MLEIVLGGNSDAGCYGNGDGCGVDAGVSMTDL